MTVPERAYRSTTAALGLDPLEAQIRQVFFFDTPELALDQAGVVVRARRVPGATPTRSIKLRPVVPSELPAAVRRSPNFVVEVDAMPGGYVCSGSMKGTVASAAVTEAVARTRPLRKLYSKEQRQFFSDHAPAGIALDDLAVLGPIFVLKLKVKPADLAQVLVVELWLYPDGTRVAELSTKCPPGQGIDVAMKVRGFLEGKNLDLSGDQQTKTRTALEFFSAELQAAR